MEQETPEVPVDALAHVQYRLGKLEMLLDMVLAKVMAGEQEEHDLQSKGSAPSTESNGVSVYTLPGELGHLLVRVDADKNELQIGWRAGTTKKRTGVALFPGSVGITEPLADVAGRTNPYRPRRGRRLG